MEILILNHFYENENGGERKFVHYTSSRYEDEVEKDGLLELVNKKVIRRYRDTWIENDEEGTEKEPTTDPLQINSTFLWEGSMFAFVSDKKLVLQKSKTGARVLLRFIKSLYEENEVEEKSKTLTSQISWRVIPSLPFTVEYKREVLVDFATYRSIKSGFSPNNVWLKNEWLEFIVSGNVFYVRGQSFYYDSSDEGVLEFIEYGAKEKIIDYIKKHDKEFTPQTLNEEIEEDNN